MAQLVARYLGVVEAAGSSPVTQITKTEGVNPPFSLFFEVFSHFFVRFFNFRSSAKNGSKTAKNGVGTKFGT